MWVRTVIPNVPGGSQALWRELYGATSGITVLPHGVWVLHILFYMPISWKLSKCLICFGQITHSDGMYFRNDTKRSTDGVFH